MARRKIAARPAPRTARAERAVHLAGLSRRSAEQRDELLELLVELVVTPDAPLPQEGHPGA